MIYLAGNRLARRLDLLDKQIIGLMNTPKSGYRIRPDWIWAADNGCFGSGYPGDEAWLAWLQRFDESQKAGCLFVTAPDVVGNAKESLARSLPFLPIIRNLGWPVALVSQDGMQPEDVPWDQIDWIFVGGTNKHKLGPEAKNLIAAAHDHGKKIYIGRVNSQKRFLAFAALGADSVDGTFLGFAPDENLPKLLGWIKHHQSHEPLFEMR